MDITLYAILKNKITEIRQKLLNVVEDAADMNSRIVQNANNIEKKLDKNQGASNSGKITGINESGDIVPMFPQGVTYNEDTQCLEYGADEKLNLNAGIQLDDTLSKVGYAADAASVGELKGDLDKLNEGGLNIKDEIIAEDVSNWLNKHPEATTTVQDGAVTRNKMSKIQSKELYGIKNNACVENLNNANADAQIMDFRTPSQIAKYNSIDHVTSFRGFITLPPKSCQPISFTEMGVTVNDAKDIKLNSILACYDGNGVRYRGIVTEINGNNITVSGWFRDGNEENGQIPTDISTILIDVSTLSLVDNVYARLKADSEGNVCGCAEYDLFNSKYSSNKNAKMFGINMVAFEGKTHYGYRIAPSGTNELDFPIDIGYWAIDSYYGFRSDGANYPFYALDSEGNSIFVVDKNGKMTNYDIISAQKGIVASDKGVIGFKTENNHFYVDKYGVQRCHREKIQTQGSNNLNIDPINGTIFLLTANSTYTVANATDYDGFVIEIVPMSGSVVLSFDNCRLSPPDGSASVTSYNCVKRNTLKLIAANGFWYAI